MDKMEIKNADFTAFFTAEDIICHINVKNRNELFSEILKNLAYNKGIGNVNDAYNAVLEREEGYSTVLSKGLALPHPRLATIHELVIGIATSKEGIVFDGDLENPVRVVIMILTPKDKPSLYLQVLSSVSKVLAQEGVVDKLASFTDNNEIWRFLNRSGLDFPDYICAGDIMNSNFSSLKENATLEQAIDLFVNENMNDVPVLDADGDIVGIVSTSELLRVCLPDYILWMDDLSPIINFEPFSHILLHESNTSLAEIMSFDFASVGEKDPAIMVAQEITKHKTGQAYVLRDKKLVGVITMQQFLNKVLRE